MIITIDGPAAAGKGTLSQKLAQKYKLAYFDTGMIYRAVGMELIRRISPMVKPLCTRAEKPPIKFTPTSLAARSRVSANSVEYLDGYNKQFD